MSSKRNLKGMNVLVFLTDQQRAIQHFPRGWAKKNLPGTHSVPADKVKAEGLRGAPTPSNDFNTRIVLFGRDGAQARVLADALGKTAMQNVSYFPGPFEELAAAVKAP